MEQGGIVPAKQTGLNAFWLKIIAIVGMTLDHVALVFGDMLSLPVKCFMFFAGGFTFPIMACLMSVGYYKTSNLKRYMLRLLVFALIAQVPFMLALHMYSLNVLFTLLLGLCAMKLYDTMKNRALFWVVFVGMALSTIAMDWAIFGISLMILLHIFHEKGKGIALPILCAIGPMLLMMLFSLSAVMIDPTVLDMVLPNVFFSIGSLCVIPLMRFYNGQQGPRIRYFFYVYYPAHLLVLAVLHMLVTGVPLSFH